MEKVFETTDKLRGSVMREFKKHRENILEILQNSNATPIRHDHGGAGYACCFCIQQYPDPADLKSHTLQSHTEHTSANFLKKQSMHGYCVKLDITSLNCKLCETNFDCLNIFMNHLKNEHDRNIDIAVKNYIIPFKFESKELRCSLCLISFGRFKQLQEHMNVHYRNFVCQICDTGFVNQAGLSRHSRGHKTGVFGCAFCAKVFDTITKRAVHERSVHDKIKLYKCGFCSEKFGSMLSKQKHLHESHGVTLPSFVCKACDRRFTTHVAMSRHVRKYHLLERRHECGECDKTFFSASDLANHSVKHTKLRRFKCEVCSKAFSLNKALREHMRIHNNDRRFKCEYCGQDFVQKCSWKGHMRNKHRQNI